MNASDDITIRTARPEDADAMSQCVCSAYEHYIERMGKPPGPMLDDYPRVIAEHTASVAERDGEIVGIVVLIERPEGPLLDNVAVSPAAQGTGLGGRLIRLAEEQATERGHSFIELYTHEVMVENVGIYERLGYVQTRRIEEKGYSRIYMRKALTPK